MKSVIEKKAALSVSDFIRWFEAIILNNPFGEIITKVGIRSIQKNTNYEAHRGMRSVTIRKRNKYRNLFSVLVQFASDNIVKGNSKNSFFDDTDGDISPFSRVHAGKMSAVLKFLEVPLYSTRCGNAENSILSTYR